MTPLRYSAVSLSFCLSVLLASGALSAAEWPELPAKDAAAELPAQEWPQRPGPRRVRVLVHYPGGSLDGVNAATGVMLTLHNWGGSDCVGTADPRALAQLSAAFNAFAFPAEEAFGRSVSLHALDAETAINGSTRIGETLLTDCLAMARNSRLKVDRDPATWQRLIAELRLPPNTDFILIRIGLAHTNKAQRRETFDGHYLDGVRLTLARRAPLP